MVQSLFRAMLARSRANLRSFQQQAKLLQRASKDIFGVEYPLTRCQEAIAASHGLGSWRGIAQMLQLTGADRDTPIWAIDHRSPLHVAIDAALMQGEIPHDPHANTLLYGIADTALNVTMTAWVEEMNQRSLPGLLLIDTEARSLEESSVWGAVDALGLVELMNGFRCLDTRLNHLPGRIYANAVVWRQAINSVTFDDANFRQSGTMAVIEQAMRERAFLGINSELAPVSSSSFLEACSLAADPGVLVENLLDEIERKAPDRHVFRDYHLGIAAHRAHCGCVLPQVDRANCTGDLHVTAVSSPVIDRGWWTWDGWPRPAPVQTAEANGRRNYVGCAVQLN